MLKGGDPLHHPTAVNALPEFLPLPSLLAQKPLEGAYWH